MHILKCWNFQIIVKLVPFGLMHSKSKKCASDDIRFYYTWYSQLCPKVLETLLFSWFKQIFILHPLHHTLWANVPVWKSIIFHEKWNFLTFCTHNCTYDKTWKITRLIALGIICPVKKSCIKVLKMQIFFQYDNIWSCLRYSIAMLAWPLGQNWPQ